MTRRETKDFPAIDGVTIVDVAFHDSPQTAAVLATILGRFARVDVRHYNARGCTDYASAEVWTENGWTNVWTIPAFRLSSHHGRVTKESDLRADAVAVLRAARRILAGPQSPTPEEPA